MSDLFDLALDASGSCEQPLTELVRPKKIEDIIGQEQILKSDGLLISALRNNKLGSYIFFGPPGVGKTTFAKLLAKESKYHFEQVSGVTASSSDFRNILDVARVRKASGSRTIVFIDEVHRLNKNQQDIFLTPLENGLISLVGATTEHPNFQINNSLLSRLLIINFRELNIESLESILKRAEGIIGKKLPISKEQRGTLVRVASGDSRALLNRAEFILSLERQISEKEFNELISNTNFNYTKTGSDHYNHASALQKSIRGSDVDAALYWLARMILGGEDRNYILRRVLRCSYEDIGLADPTAQSICLNAWDAYERLGSPEGDIVLAKAVIYLSMAPKSNSLYEAFEKVLESARNTSAYPVPEHLVNWNTPPTAGERQKYKSDHSNSNGFSGQEFFPKKLTDQRYYYPVDRGFEKEIGKRVKYFHDLKKKIQSGKD